MPIKGKVSIRDIYLMFSTLRSLILLGAHALLICATNTFMCLFDMLQQETLPCCTMVI